MSHTPNHTYRAERADRMVISAEFDTDDDAWEWVLSNYPDATDHAWELIPTPRPPMPIFAPAINDTAATYALSQINTTLARLADIDDANNCDEMPTQSAEPHQHIGWHRGTRESTAAALTEQITRLVAALSN